MLKGGSPDERTIALLWERQTYDQVGLGRLGFTLLFRGVPSDAGGPDYQDAILVEGGRRIVSGDVEFHVRSSDWYRHGHHRNERYNSVVLHVVWQEDTQPTIRADGAQIPTLALEGLVARIPSSLPTPQPLFSHPCVEAFARTPSTDLRAEIEAAGLLRLAERIDRFAAEMETVSPDQVVYTALFEAMGYASNRDAFRRLAEAVPCAWLLQLKPDTRAGALLEASGLGPPSGVCVPAHMDVRSWRLARLRPANHPERRIRGMAILLSNLRSAPADAVLEAVAAGPTAAALRRVFMAGEGGTRYVGPGRADEIVVSVALPVAAAYAGDATHARFWYERYPSPPSNRWTRIMRSFLQEAGHDIPTARAIHHQGLHHLYHQSCRKGPSPSCGICGDGVRRERPQAGQAETPIATASADERADPHSSRRASR